jgi:hypothetical protein
MSKCDYTCNRNFWIMQRNWQNSRFGWLVWGGWSMLISTSLVNPGAHQRTCSAWRSGMARVPVPASVCNYSWACQTVNKMFKYEYMDWFKRWLTTNSI